MDTNENVSVLNTNVLDRSISTETSIVSEAFVNRIKVTAEVAVSKIFPAGFGWQYFSSLAGDMGFASTDMGMAVMTGVGDALGVGLGHAAYFAVKKAVMDKAIDMSQQLQIALFLGSASLFSGTAWQPTVNACHDHGLGFTSTALITGGVCGTAFLVGLRGGRNVYGRLLSHIEKPTMQNLVADAQLSAAIGGAGACFVGTDVSFGEGNFLLPYLGVDSGTSVLTGSVLAGTSTALGFLVVQSGQNVAVPRSKCWVD
jgi:hypothetical protein